MLSVDRADMAKPQETFETFVGQGFEAVAVISLWNSLCHTHEVPGRWDPVEWNEAHSFLDYRTHSKAGMKKIARRLFQAAFPERVDWSYNP